MTTSLLPVTDHGLFTAAEAGAQGVDAGELARSRQRGEVTRLRRGVYAAHDVARLAPRDRHLLEVRALLRSVERPGTVSHESAAVVHGMDLYERDLGLLHLTRADRRASRQEAASTTTWGSCPTIRC